MKRTPDQALAALESQIRTWARTPRPPEIRILDYPPEQEAVMLGRIRSLVRRLEEEGLQVEVEDVGQGFRAALEGQPVVERLLALDGSQDRHIIHDLGVLASRYLRDLFRRPPSAGAVCRLLVNSGALATVTSYSAVTNELYGAKGEAGPAAPAIIAFPGEADDRSMNLLGLRRETNYRTPRI